MKLHILDNGFASKVGHHFEYTRSVYEEWVGRGNEASIYCTPVDDEAVRTKFNIVPAFSIDPREYYSSVRIPQLANKFLHLNGALDAIAGNRSFLSDLKKVGKGPFASDDIVLVHTLSQTSLVALYLWYRSFALAERPWLVLLFRYATMQYGHPKKPMPSYYFYKFLIKLLERLPGSGKIFFTTDSDVLEEEYRTMARRKVHVLPMPNTPVLPRKAPASPTNAKTFVYIGHAAERKGYHLLPAAIDFVTANRKSRQIRFLIQSNCLKYPRERVMQAKRELLAMGGGVEIIGRVLDTKEYYGLLLRADAVVIPYTAESYHAQTSGIFGEALAFGKSVIIPVGTWMEREFVKYKSGGVLFRLDDEGSLGRAMLSYLENSEDAKKRAHACMLNWVKYHNAGNYMDTLLAIVRGRQ